MVESLTKQASGNFEKQLINSSPCCHVYRSFVAGTPIRTPDGPKPIEQLVPGEFVLARPEHDPSRMVRSQRIEETFQTTANILRLMAGGQVLETTSTHPFYGVGKGWTPAGDLQPGDLLLGQSDETTPVEAVQATGRTEKVYNFRVANDHTYFVGDNDWNFSLWGHNCCGSDIFSVLRRSAIRRILLPIKNCDILLEVQHPEVLVAQSTEFSGPLIAGIRWS